MKQSFAQAGRAWRSLWRRASHAVQQSAPVRWLRSKLPAPSAEQDIRWQPDGKSMAEQYAKSNRQFLLTRIAAWYVVLVIGSLLFTQLLRSRASNIFFWFVLLMVPALLIYTLIAKHALQASINTQSAEIEKLSEFQYEFVMINSSPLAFPFVDAILSLPRDDAVRTLIQMPEHKLLQFIKIDASVRMKRRHNRYIAAKEFHMHAPFSAGLLIFSSEIGHI